MQVRMPKFDVSRFKVNWCPGNHAFNQHNNSYSVVPAYLEPWLVKVMREAREHIASEETQLIEAVDVFIGQESQHFRQHRTFNRCLRDAYPEIEPLERWIEQEYERLDKRPLKFKLAYAEGFETLGPQGAHMWFDYYLPFAEGADAEVIAMWQWHMAEEFEHREVCFNLFHHLYSRGLWGRIWNGWLYRCYVFVFAMRHLRGLQKAVFDKLLEIDRNKMAPEERERSERQQAEFSQMQKQKGLPALLRVFSPFYDPKRLEAPAAMSGFLDSYDRGGARSKVAA